MVGAKERGMQSVEESVGKATMLTTNLTKISDVCSYFVCQRYMMDIITVITKR
jgi:hypothetical protein